MRIDAICLRAELLQRDFSLDPKSAHVVPDLVRMIPVRKWKDSLKPVP